MGRPRLKLEGRRFGRLVVVEYAGLSPQFPHPARFRCKCDCGNVCEVTSSRLSNGHTRSCGCLIFETLTRNGFASKRHGESKSNAKAGFRAATPEYRIWDAMKARCCNLNNKHFKNYGGRGIRVCDRWLDSFANFLADVGRRPSPNHSIDRINNDGNYEPGNVRWATRHEQNLNKRPSIPKGTKRKPRHERSENERTCP